jgi:hypothetical protein
MSIGGLQGEASHGSHTGTATGLQGSVGEMNGGVHSTAHCTLHTALHAARCTLHSARDRAQVVLTAKECICAAASGRCQHIKRRRRVQSEGRDQRVGPCAAVREAR